VVLARIRLQEASSSSDDTKATTAYKSSDHLTPGHQSSGYPLAHKHGRQGKESREHLGAGRIASLIFAQEFLERKKCMSCKSSCIKSHQEIDSFTYWLRIDSLSYMLIFFLFQNTITYKIKGTYMSDIEYKYKSMVKFQSSFLSLKRNFQS